MLPEAVTRNVTASLVTVQVVVISSVCAGSTVDGVGNFVCTVHLHNL